MCACVFAVSGGCRGGFSFWDIREIGRDIGGRERGRARESEGEPITDWASEDGESEVSDPVPAHVHVLVFF